MDTSLASWGFPTGNNSTTAQQSLGDKLDQSVNFDLMPGFFSNGTSSLSYKDNRSEDDKLMDFIRGSGDEASQDLYINWLLNEKSLTDAYKRELEADSTKYQRLVQDLRKAGLNPMFALNGANAGNINSSGGSYSSGYETARHNKQSEKNQREANLINFIGKIISSAIGIAFVAG